MAIDNSEQEFDVLTHDMNGGSFETCLKKREEEIHLRGDLPDISVKAQIDLLRKVSESSMGKFLIQNRGLNGYWTDYILMHPRRKGEDIERTTLEKFFLKEAPTSLATQERLTIFQQILQREVREGVVMASVPCGLMSELLTLDFSGIDEVTLIGSDIDIDSIELALKRAREVKFKGKVLMSQGDAWKLDFPFPVDVLTSNGLNIYEPDDTRVVALYKSFFDQIKPGGVLVTSFLTPPPTLDPESEWRLDQVNLEHLKLQKEIFIDVIGVSWQAYRSSELTKRQLEAAGFVDIEITPDRAHLFPTVLARRPQTSA